MLRNVEVTGLMIAISLKLSSPAREPNHGLWTIYDLLQAWKLDVEWDYPGIGIDRSQEIAAVILETLETLPDRELARDIVRKNTPSATEKDVNDSACGRVTNWAGHADTVAVKYRHTRKSPHAGTHHATTPAA